MSYLAPAGTPIPLALFGTALLQGLREPDVADRLASTLARHSGHSRSWLISTGRAAMVVALEAMREVVQDPRRTEVIVPGYTCYSVPASVLRAGLKPRLCDIDPRTLSLNLDRLRQFDFSRVLAIVTANLYGVPNALAEIEAIARNAGVLMLDDAAQALGAQYAGRPAGGFGDIGLYSFDKGKNITSMDGGALVTSHPALADAIDRRHRSLAPTPASKSGITVIKLLAYSLLLQPRLYGIVRRAPFLGLGKTVYEDSYPLLQYHRVLAGFAGQLYARLPEFTATRRNNANALALALRSIRGIDQVELLDSSVPGFTRLPVLVADQSLRAKLIDALDHAGVGATTSYPKALSDVPELAAHLQAEDLAIPGARQVADRIVTLPVHPYCPPDYALRVARTLESAFAGSAGTHNNTRSVLS